MGHVFANLELSNPREPDLAPIKARALADTGALMLCLPEHLALQLGLVSESVREVSVADGRRREVLYVEPVRVGFGQRFYYVGALVLGDEVLLGTVPMEDMDCESCTIRRQARRSGFTLSPSLTEEQVPLRLSYGSNINRP